MTEPVLMEFQSLGKEKFFLNLSQLSHIKDSGGITLFYMIGGAILSTRESYEVVIERIRNCL